MPKRDQIVLRAELGELGRLHEWLQAFCQSHRLPEQLSFGLDLCLTELVTNIINYAYPNGPAPQDAVAVHLVLNTADVFAEVTDRGIEFDPVAHVPGAPARSLDEAEVGGRGLLLVRKFATELQYRRERGGNQLSFRVPAPLNTGC